MGQEAIILISIGVLLIIFTVVFLMSSAKQLKETEEKKQKGVEKKEKSAVNSGNNNGVKTAKKDVARADMSKFINFDKISDNMIVQNGGKKYTMVLQCKGINYDLMSEVEQMAVEEGFITFLNTLKQPIQLYVQARTVDLDENIRLYKEKVNDLSLKRQEIIREYNTLDNDIDSDRDEIARLKYEKNRITNIYEYAADITRYVEKISLNQTMLQRKFYILVSYYRAELSTAEHFTPQEYQDLCHRELYTRAQGLASSLQPCSVECKILNSNEIAEFLYIAYNRDDEKIIDVKKALESGFYRLYSTSEDVRVKRQEMLDKEIREEGLKRVEQAIKDAIDSGVIVDENTMNDNVDKEIDRTAIKIIDNSEINKELKNILKDNVMKNRQERIKKRQEESEIMELDNEQVQEEFDEIDEIEKNENIIETNTEDNIDDEQILE